MTVPLTTTVFIVPHKDRIHRALSMQKLRLPAARGPAQAKLPGPARGLQSPKLSECLLALQPPPGGTSRESPTAQGLDLGGPCPARPLSACHREPENLGPSPHQSALNILFQPCSCLKDLNFPPKEPLGFPDAPSSGTRVPTSQSWPGSDSPWPGGGLASPTRCWPLGPSTHRKWLVRPPEASPWICQARGSQTRLHIRIIWGSLKTSQQLGLAGWHSG